MATPHAIGWVQHATQPPLRVLRQALTALAAVALPGWLHGMPPSGAWAPLAAVITVLAARHCTAGRLTLCLAAVALGMLLDFARVPPVLLMSLCSTPEPGWWALLLSHARMFPATSLLMLGLLLPRALPQPRRRLRAVAEMAGMLTAMTLSMELCRRAAVLLGASWGPDAWACAMAAGMIGFEVILRRNVCELHP